jgi:hypothetical protein
MDRMVMNSGARVKNEETAKQIFKFLPFYFPGLSDKYVRFQALALAPAPSV